MLGPVIADAAADLGWGEQTPSLVGANVAHRHPGLRRQLLDRQVVRLAPVLAVLACPRLVESSDRGHGSIIRARRAGGATASRRRCAAAPGQTQPAWEP